MCNSAQCECNCRLAFLLGQRGSKTRLAMRPEAWVHLQKRTRRTTRPRIAVMPARILSWSDMRPAGGDFHSKQRKTPSPRPEPDADAYRKLLSTAQGSMRGRSGEQDRRARARRLDRAQQRVAWHLRWSSCGLRLSKDESKRNTGNSVMSSVVRSYATSACIP